MDTSSSLSSSSSFSSSLNASSSFSGSDANPSSFPYTPSSLARRRWRGSDRETPRFFCESISGASAGGHHFLDACFLCKKPIAANDNVFMYRGDAPFCSEECREEQMEMDEALENNRKNFFSSSSSSPPPLKNSSSSVSSTMKRKPSLIIRPNSRNVHAVVAGY
ncbi:uncharacterized protein [Elaeis guineensis]|uniref:Uncharacterized protein LOC105059598 n=1 Tax=Elaeis guineensis var. tenera TaxID=51953 RepID=A0A6I9SC35_ELAGV|nr:uncharacterized protein LOC105059598 [Elaeis guineensis]